MSSPSLSSSDHDILSEALVFTRNIPLAPPAIRKLESPIAIPQTAPGLGRSFLRAWAPVLQYHDIKVRDFVAFIDNLNVVSTASPPLQILDLAGGFMGMVPHHWAIVAGHAMQGTAKLGSAAVSMGRTELYMREMNATVFMPRGLKASLVSTNAMRAVLRIPVDRPILAPLTAETMALSTVERVVIAVGPYNAVLDLNVPPPTEQVTKLALLSAKQVAAQEKRMQKKDLKHREKALRKTEEKKEKENEKKEKENEKREKDERKAAKKEEERLEKEEEKTKRKERKAKNGKELEEMHRKMQEKAEEKRRKMEKKEKKEKKRDERHRNGKERTHSDSESDDEKPSKEMKRVQKLVWIMIENL